MPMPPPLKRRPNFRPKPQPTEAASVRPEESQLSMAELILQNALQMSAMAANPTSDFGRIYKELLGNLQQQQQQLQSSLFPSGLPYLDPALFLQSLSRVSFFKRANSGLLFIYSCLFVLQKRETLSCQHDTNLDLWSSS